VFILEKESSTGASNHKLVLSKALERRVVGNLDLQETTKGPLCHFQGLLEVRRDNSAQGV
jgi:hypothetical protein